MFIRQSPIAGTWYPGSAARLAAAIEGYLERAARPEDREVAGGELVAIASPHAGLVYSGPVAAHAYRLLRGRRFDVAVLVGPSHYVAFDGVAVVPEGGFETPLGVAAIDVACAADLLQATSVIHAQSAVHAREHSLEMQLPFLQRVAPAAAIVPLLMGHQTASTAQALGDALAAVLADRRALLVASTDLSHYHDATTAARLDEVVLKHAGDFDADGLQRALDRRPDHACGGGPTVAVMRAARALGARDARVLQYADSGDVSGDKTSVVGYMAAAFGNFTPRAATGR
jgi:AmmeMemoRadiSam system protein B